MHQSAYLRIEITMSCRTMQISWSVCKDHPFENIFKYRSAKSDVLSFQLSAEPNLTVLDPRTQLIPGSSSARSLVSKRLNFRQCLPSKANTTTIFNPYLSSTVNTSMTDLIDENFQRVFGWQWCDDRCRAGGRASLCCSTGTIFFPQIFVF